MHRDVSLQVGPYIVPLLVIALVALRLIWNKPRKVKPNRLFVLPLFLTLAAASTLAQSGPPGLLWFLVYAAAAGIGGAVGFLSARHREFTLDRETGMIMSRATPVGTIIFAVLFAVCFGLKLAFPELNGGHTPYGLPSVMNPHPALRAIGWTDAGLVFSTAMVLSTAATTWWRTRHLVGERRARAESIGETRPVSLTSGRKQDPGIT